MPPKVIVIQTAGLSAQLCLEEVLKLGLTPDDVVVSSHIDPWIDDYIQPGSKQLLVTGTHYGDESAANAFVLRMKAKNPELKAWFCSLISLGDPRIYEKTFGVTTNKDGWYYEIMMAEVKKYINSL